MKIVLSPSKTKTIADVASNDGVVNHAVRDGQFQPHITQEIIKHVQSLDVTALGKALKLKDDKAQSLFDFYQAFDSQPVGIACESYDGIAFKYLDWQNLSDEAKSFGESHLVVMSALYGVVEPNMGVRDYRLDMVDKVGINLYDIWRETVDAYFHKEDWILNLASKEYAKCIERYLSDKDNYITITFCELSGDKLVTKGTYAKMARGEMVRFMAENNIENPVDIQKFDRLGYTFRGNLSSETEYVFERKVEK